LRWQLGFVGEVLSSVLPFTHAVEHLYIYGPQYSSSQWQDGFEHIDWLEIFHPFTAVKNLYLSEVSELRIAPALNELVGGRTIEVLPALQNIYFDGSQSSGSFRHGIRKFVAARQLSGHPITVVWRESRHLGSR
jgi:hypothetical protein